MCVERDDGVIMTDVFIETLERVMAVEYSIIVSKHSSNDSPFHHKHCPTDSVFAQKLQGKTCLAILGAEAATSFLR